MFLRIVVAFLLISSITSHGQNKTDVLSDHFAMVRELLTGESAHTATAFVEGYWRIAGNTGFDTTIYYLASKLEEAGYVEETKATAKDALTYRIEKRAMKRPTWEPVSAEVTIIGSTTPLLQSSTNLNMLGVNSYSTPDNGVTAEVIKVNPAEISSANVKGKIVYVETSPGAVFTKAVAEGGAVGVISYSNPGYLQPEKNKTSIQFRGIPLKEDLKSWGIALSYEAKEKLDAALASGRVKLNVKIQTEIYPSKELTIVADAKGTNTNDRLVFSAHIQEPGANDNASGAGAQLEMAQVTAQLVKSGKLKLNRTITFLWGDEIVSTRRYIQEDKKRARQIKWGISLDMVGENTAVTGGSFLIEKMPDPSAIWTRGEDKHSEWGAGNVSMDDMRPHYLNDFIIMTMKAQGKSGNWIVNTNPFEGGSDHTPFIDAKIPGLLLWHFTDQFYHTDNDRIDKVSKETLRNVATGALVSAITLANADINTGRMLVQNTMQSAKDRLDAEFKLSRKAIKDGGDRNEELKIMNAWSDWYSKALQSIDDIDIKKEAPQLKKLIDSSLSELDKLSSNYISQLKSL